MLKDTDRIFKNLYGDESFDLSSAQNRGDWIDTKAIILKGKDWIIDEKAYVENVTLTICYQRVCICNR